MVRRAAARGFGLTELLVVIAVGAVLVAVAVPLGLSYYHGAQTKAGAQQIRSILNQARQIAIDERTFVCVDVPTPTQLRLYVSSTCSGTAWRGAITDGDGNIALQPGFTVSASASPVFDYLGRALPAAIYTVTSSATGSTLTVSVAISGRITIP